ncbi:MAG: hypothetical protein ACE366_31050 [Bradymonadia bacterium]
MNRLFALPMMLLVPTLTTGCDTEGKDASGNAAVTRADVEAIEEGSGQGVIHTGIWTLQTEVTATNCDLVNVGGVLPLPEEGDEDEESIELVHKQGDLDRPSADLGEGVVGDSFVFEGQFNADKTFKYGQVFEIEIGGQLLRRTEIVEGRLETDDGGKMTATANRRYEADSLVDIDCSADVRITGTRSLTGNEGDEGEE